MTSKIAFWSPTPAVYFLEGIKRSYFTNMKSFTLAYPLTQDCICWNIVGILRLIASIWDLWRMGAIASDLSASIRSFVKRPFLSCTNRSKVLVRILKIYSKSNFLVNLVFDSRSCGQNVILTRNTVGEEPKYSAHLNLGYQMLSRYP